MHMMLTRRKSASRGGYATSHSLQQSCAQTTCQRSCFCKHRCNLWCLCSSRTRSNLIKRQTALCYRKNSKRICSACFPSSPSYFCQPADRTEEATAFSAASFLFRSSLLWSSLPCSHAHLCPRHSSCVPEGLPQL